VPMTAGWEDISGSRPSISSSRGVWKDGQFSERSDHSRSSPGSHWPVEPGRRENDVRHGTIQRAKDHPGELKQLEHRKNGILEYWNNGIKKR